MAFQKELEETTALNAKKQPTGRALVGKNVRTAYGIGVVKEFRLADEIYVVSFSKEGSNSLNLLYTPNHPERVKTQQEEIDELNIAYEALERMRRLNLEMECFEHGVTNVQYDHCKTCLLSKDPTEDSNRFPRLQKFVDSAKATAESATTSAAAATTNPNSFPRLRKLWGTSTAPTTQKQEEKPVEDKKPATKTKVLPRIQKFMDNRQQASAAPCLICASPVCSQHSSSNFRKEGIALCLSCERLFELDFIVDCVSTPDAVERAKRIDHMIELYDRCNLLLKYSMQYSDQIAEALKQQKEQQNKIGLGSSGVGMISGVLGIAAAATILTPAGPPLLIASLFFGGGATAVQTGTEAYNYFSEPNKLADRIIALHGMILSILRVTSTLRDAMMRDHIRTDVFEAEPTSLTSSVHETIEKNKAGVLAASNVGRAATLGSVAGVEAGGAAIVSAEAAAGAGARGATALSRAGTAAARTVRFARFAGGALSAAVLVMEANAIHTTLHEISSGSPCDKADRIQAIAKEVKNEDLPSTAELDEECQAYLVALASRPAPPPEVVAEEATDASAQDFPQAECDLAPAIALDSSTMMDSSLILAGEQPPVAVATVPRAASSSQMNSSSFAGASSSFLQRLPFNHAVGSSRRSNRSDEVMAVAMDEVPNGQNQEINLVV